MTEQVPASTQVVAPSLYILRKLRTYDKEDAKTRKRRENTRCCDAGKIACFKLLEHAD